MKVLNCVYYRAYTVHTQRGRFICRLGLLFSNMSQFQWDGKYNLQIKRTQHTYVYMGRLFDIETILDISIERFIIISIHMLKTAIRGNLWFLFLQSLKNCLSASNFIEIVFFAQRQLHITSSVRKCLTNCFLRFGSNCQNVNLMDYSFCMQVKVNSYQRL